QWHRDDRAGRPAQTVMRHRTGNISGSPVRIRTGPDDQQIGIGSPGNQNRSSVTFGELQLPARLRTGVLEDPANSPSVRGTHLLLRKMASLIELNRSTGHNADRPFNPSH